MGFDLGRAVIVDSRQSQGMEFTNENGELDELQLDELAFEQIETMAFLSYSGLKLDKLAGYLVRSEFPSMDERDLMSLGTWEAHDYAMQFNDGDVFEADRVRFKADSFAWFIPEDISLEVSGAQIGTKEIAEAILAFIPEDIEPETTDPAAELEDPVEFKKNFRTAIAKLEETGLDTIPFDISFRANWNAGSGETGFLLESASEGFGTGSASLDITLPDYSGVQQAYESEDREAAFDEAFENAFAFRGARFFETDDGGYDKMFAYANAIGNIFPQEGWGAMLGAMDPPQMRNFIANIIRSGKGVAADEFPPAADWMESIAQYYQTSGGSIEFKAAPPAPLTVQDFEDYDADADPEQIVEDFGLSVTHSDE